MSGNTSATGGYLVPSNLPPPLDDGLADILQGWVVGITGLPGSMVRPRWQKNPPPAPPIETDWCAIGITRAIPDEYGQIIHHPGTAPDFVGHDSVTVHWTLEALASFYGPRAYGYAERLKVGALVWQNRAALRAVKMGVREMNNIINAVELVSAEFRPRHDLPMVLLRATEHEYAVLNLLAVQGAVHTDGGTVQSFNTQEP